MPERHEFSAPIKKELEYRVSSICSKPGCGNVTRGPKEGEPDSSINVGEAGHITAAAEGGPRFDASMMEEERSSFSNGIWLCRRCHKVVDADHSPYDAEELKRWKSDAEGKARRAVEFSEAAADLPALVSVLHKSMEDIPDGALQGSMPEVFTSNSNMEVVVNACDLYAGGIMREPLQAMERNIQKRDELTETLNSYPSADVAYYGIAHIPLAMHFGFLLSTKVAPYFAEKNRTTEAWHWLGAHAPTVSIIEEIPDGRWQTETDAVIRIGVSYPVLSDQTDPIITSSAIFGFGLENPGTDKITSRCEVELLAKKFRAILDAVTTATSIERIHVFASVPMCVAFALGQQISATIHPPVTAYNYRRAGTPLYKWGIRMTDDLTDEGVHVTTEI